MGLIVYPAAKGFKPNGAEALMSLMEEDTILGGNLINRPNNVNYWTSGSSATLEQRDFRTIKITNGAASNAYGYRTFPTTNGKYYLIRAFCTPDGTTSTRMFAATSAGGTPLGASPSSTSAKWHFCIFKATGSLTYAHFQNYTATIYLYSHWNDFEIIELETLTSSDTIAALDANGVDLSIAGEIVKVPVFPGAATCAYMNFGSSNYIYQAFNSNLNPSSGDLSFSCLFKIPDSTAAIRQIFRRDSETTAQNYRCNIDASGYANVNIDDNTTDRTTQSTATLDDGEFHHLGITYDQSTGTITMYIDGDYDSEVTGAALNTLDNASALLFIGRGITTLAQPFTDGMIAGIKLDIGNLWTAQKMKSDYESEIVLFKPDTAFGIVGTNIYLECDLATTDDTPEHDIHTSVSLSKKNRVDTIVSDQDSFSNVLTQFSESKVKDFKKFRDEAYGQVFTFDAAAYRYGQYYPRSVMKTTKNEPINRDGQSKYFTMSFNVQDMS